MKMRSILALFAVLAMAGCVVEDGDDDDDGVSDSSDDGADGGDDEPDDGDNEPDDGSDGGAGDVEPRSGVWDYSDYNANQNDCNVPEDYGNGGGGFGLVNNGGGSFTVIPNDGTEAFDCSLDGADFDCPDRATEEAVVDADYDAVLIGQAVAEGTFSDSENATGSQTAEIDCEGADCGLLEAATGASFPCTLSVDYVIEWRSGP